MKLKHLIIPALLLATLGLKAQHQSSPPSKELVAQDEAFLKKNKTQPGVVETPSGLQYKVIKMGAGKKPMKFSRVSINPAKLSKSQYEDSWKGRGVMCSL